MMMLFFLVFCLQFLQLYSKPPILEQDALLNFKDCIANNIALSSWNKSRSPPCSGGEKENWIGVLCEKGQVYGLKLDNMGLSGDIDVFSLNKLRVLRFISLMNNNFEGGLPNLKKLGALKAVYLSHNKFSGEIEPDAFYGMGSLKKVYLSNNDFSGMIPWSLTYLPKLIELSLEGNDFNGLLPEFRLSNLSYFNVSNNDLQGQIPVTLSYMEISSFQGNPYLCGPPLEPCTSSKKLSSAVIATVITVVVTALLAVATVFVIFRSRKRAADSGDVKAGKVDSGGSSHHRNMADNNNNGKLTFLREEREIFELKELLGASAEILGSGYFGASFKAALKSGKMMVVKRFMQMNNVGKEEFQDHMWTLGGLRNKNLMPIVAFYYRNEEKLLVTDYAPNVSLALHLHGNKALGQSLDWPTRLKIIKGVANGLQCLYNELPSLIAPHGHLKSSNVLLNESMEPLLVDYGLIPVVNSELAQEFMVAYKSPEYKQSRRITKKTDVWSFGILILETVTGKFPATWWLQGKGNDTDLVAWVDSLAPEALSESVFDKDMQAANGSEGEIMKMLRIGLACADSNIKKRYDLKEAVERIEEVREREHDDDFYSSYASDCDARSSRGLSDDFLFVYKE